MRLPDHVEAAEIAERGGGGRVEHDVLASDDPTGAVDETDHDLMCPRAAAAGEPMPTGSSAEVDQVASWGDGPTDSRDGACL